MYSLQWSHNGHDGVSNHQPHHCLLSRLFRRRSKKTLKLRITGLCVGRNSPVTGEFPAQMASDTENVFIWWWHHVIQNSRYLAHIVFYPQCIFSSFCQYLVQNCFPKQQQKRAQNLTSERFCYIFHYVMFNHISMIYILIFPVELPSGECNRTPMFGKWTLAQVIAWCYQTQNYNYRDVIMSMIASQITGIMIVNSTICLGSDERKHQSSASLAFVRGIPRWLVNSPHKGPGMRKMFPFDDVIMTWINADRSLIAYGITNNLWVNKSLRKSKVRHHQYLDSIFIIITFYLRKKWFQKN